MAVPRQDLEFTGERFTTLVDGETRHAHFHRYFFALQFCRGKDVLDIASGEGYGAALLSAVASRVIGVDNSAEAIRHANVNYCDRHIFFKLGAAEKLPLPDDSVDVVVSFETLEHLEDQEKFLSEIKRVLRPDGLLVMSSPDTSVYSGEKAIRNPYHVKELSRTEFLDLVRRYFRQTAFFCQDSLMGSVITPDPEEKRAVEHEGFTRLYETCFEVSPGLPSATYLLCVASDGVLPGVRVGSFDDRPFQLGLYAELQRRQEDLLRGLAEISHLREEVIASNTLRSELQTALCTLTETIAQLSQTRHELESAEQASRQRESDLQVAQCNVSELTRQLSQSRETITQTVAKLDMTRRELESAEQASRQRESDLQVAQRSVSELTIRLNQSRDSLRRVEDELARYGPEMQAMRAREKEMSESERASINALHDSLSWRVTTPLRWGINLMHKLHSLFIRVFYGSSTFCRVGRVLAKLVYVCRLPGGRVLLPESTLFSREFYARSNPDIDQRRDLWSHYIAFGADEGRDPQPMFGSSFYLAVHPDVAAGGMNPLVHYMLYGAAERRRPHPGFDPSFYLRQRPDVEQSGMNPLLHYWKHGKGEGTAPAPRALPAFSAVPIDGKASPTIAGYSAGQPGAGVREQRKSEEAAGPLISILVPTFNTPPEVLRSALESVRRQTYTRWQLCIYDDGSSRDDTRAVLEEYSRIDDPRILVEYGRSNEGISRASNAALAMARGSFTGMLDHDDELEREALAQVVAQLSQNPSLDVVYTDQDYVDVAGQRTGTLFKPDWSPEMFRGVMFVNHLLVVRTDLMRRVKGFDPAFDGLQDFDFMLRVSEATSRIAHVPRVLYHWRRIPGSVAFDANSKGMLEPRQAAAVNAHLSRCGIRAFARPHASLSHRLTIHPQERTTLPRVRIAVRSVHPDSLAKTVISLLKVTTYPNVIIYVPPALAKDMPHDSRLVEGDLEEVHRQIMPEDFLVWVDSDLEAVTPSWLEVLLMYCEQQGLACASPLIVEPTNGVWCSGLALGMDRGVGYPMTGWAPDTDGYAGSLSCSREVSAVSGECMMISGSVFRRLGGSVKYYSCSTFDGADLSMRATTIQHRNVVTPQAIMRKAGPTSKPCGWDLDEALFVDRWSDLIRQGDPYYNPHFSRSAPGYSIDPAVAEALA